MAIIEYRKRRTRQPQEAVGVDDQHGIASSLVDGFSGSRLTSTQGRYQSALTGGAPVAANLQRFGGVFAPRFDGSSEYGSIPEEFGAFGTGAFSVTLLFKTTGAITANMALIGNNGIGVAGGWEIYAPTTTTKARINTNSAFSTTLTTTADVFDGNPHLLTITRTTGGVYQWYVDGTVDATATTSAFNVNLSNPVRVAAQKNGGSIDRYMPVQIAAIFGHTCAIPFALHRQLYDAFWQTFAPRSIWVPVSAGGASAALTGTATTATEADIVAGGKTIILTLTGDTFVSAGATFDAQRANIIAGLDSAQSELLGWDNVVKALQGVSGVVRTSDTVCTITLDSQATYSITANETITATIPASALSGGVAVVAAPTFQVTEGSGASFFASWASRSTQMVGGGVYA